VYKDYKRSAYKWLPDIPSHWQELFIQQVSHEQKNKNTGNVEGLVLSLSYGNIIRKKNVDAGLVAKDLSTYQIVDKNNIILRFTDLQNDHNSLRTGLVKERGIITSAYTCIVPTINAAYLHYVLHSYDTQKVFYGMGGGVRQSIGFDDIRHMFVPVPPRKEQDQIVRYLDWQISRINKLIHGYYREIKLLEERLQSYITFMVTHDRFSEGRKDSEIYWLTDVPEKWRVTRLKHVLEKQDRPVLPNSELLICANSGEVKLRGDTKIGLVADNDDIYQGVAKGDLLIHGMDTWHGAIAISQYDGMCTPVVHVCTSNQSVRFICYYLRMMAFTKVFKAISNGVRQNTSDFRSWDKAGSLWIALPSVEEQEEIADILDNEVEKTKAEIVALKRQIELAKEYRTRLISDVVTGQMDVRGIEIPDYSPEEDTEETDEDNEETEVEPNAESDE
jgi:type I restriction enzyme S subunit